MLAFLFDTMGLLVGSSLLDSFFACSAIAVLIMVIRIIFERGT